MQNDEKNEKVSHPDFLQFTVGRDAAENIVRAKIGFKQTRRILLCGSSEGRVKFLQAMTMELAENYSPSDLRLILFDGPFSDLSVFQGLPHLICDAVAYDLPQALGAMEWAVSEMERRFSLFYRKQREGKGVFTLEDYNKICQEEEILPRILLVGEDFGGFCSAEMDGRRELRSALYNEIDRLATLGPAVGMHLILGAEEFSRPASLAALFKATPHSSFIIFHISQREIAQMFLVEEDGADLLTESDLLYRAWERRDLTAERIRGARMEEGELKQAISSVKARFDPPSLYKDAALESDLGADERKKEDIPISDAHKKETCAESSACDEEELYRRALAAVIELERASLTLIMRACGTDFDHADKIITRMEAEGCISPFDGRAERSVLITQDEFDKKYGPHTR